MGISLSMYIIDEDTLKVKEKCKQNYIYEYQLKLPKILGKTLVIYKSSEYCLKIWFLGYKYTIKLQGFNFTCNDRVINTMVIRDNYLYACLLFDDVLLVDFLNTQFLILEGKACFLTFPGASGNNYLFDKVPELRRYPDKYRLCEYSLNMKVDGIPIDSKLFKRNLILGDE